MQQILIIIYLKKLKIVQILGQIEYQENKYKSGFPQANWVHYKYPVKLI